MDKREFFVLAAATTADLVAALTRALFFIEWLGRCALFWAKHLFKMRQPLAKCCYELFKVGLKIIKTGACLCFVKGWLWIVCWWHGHPFDKRASNVAHERPSKRAKPACEGPSRWAGYVSSCLNMTKAST